MPIINQNLDISEKKVWADTVLGAVATGVTALIRLIPYNCMLQGFNLSAFGLSGTPTYSLSVYRATSGGLTSIPLGLSLAATTFGTSGPIGVTFIGSSGYGAGVTLLAGDALFMISGTADTSITTGIASSAIAALGDFKSYPNTVS